MSIAGILPCRLILWSLTYEQSVFERYRSIKHFSEFCRQHGVENQLECTWNEVTSLSPSHPVSPLPCTAAGKLRRTVLCSGADRQGSGSCRAGPVDGPVGRHSAAGRLEGVSAHVPVGVVDDVGRARPVRLLPRVPLVSDIVAIAEPEPAGPDPIPASLRRRAVDRRRRDGAAGEALQQRDGRARVDRVAREPVALLGGVGERGGDGRRRGRAAGARRAGTVRHVRLAVQRDRVHRPRGSPVLVRAVAVERLQVATRVVGPVGRSAVERARTLNRHTRNISGTFFPAAEILVVATAKLSTRISCTSMCRTLHSLALCVLGHRRVSCKWTNQNATWM